MNDQPIASVIPFVGLDPVILKTENTNRNAKKKPKVRKNEKTFENQDSGTKRKL